jgi:hypothetical protein
MIPLKILVDMFVDLLFIANLSLILDLVSFETSHGFWTS